MTRYWLGIAALAAVLMAPAAGQAATRGAAPWCATVSVGWGDLVSDCSYWDFARCRDQVLAGNRGFCTVNPAWPGPAKPRKMR